ncbi:HsdM family class I SAM-dependent methyltransferase [Burkholderia gladioli]|uniref:HsdM family class I SAM-dependent methyltransferase n=1 Tax=Burkholderia gladioli TaxID=28095 RepID=UPI003B9873F5
MSSPLTLTCPIRGVLKTGAKSKDGLKPSEEYFRVEAIRHLLRAGYPKSHFKIEAVVKRFGNSSRNSMRADFAVLDVPVAEVASGDVDSLLEHAILLCEVKRENSNQEYVKNTQVKPLLDFAKLDRCVAVYWDNVDQRVFWHERVGGKRSTREAPIALLPKFGSKIQLKPLTLADTRASDSLLDLFERIEDLLHSASIDLDQRFSVMLQLLLAKLYDEHAHQSKPKTQLDIQDFAALGNDAKTAQTYFNAVLEKAVGYYQKHLPKPIDKKLPAKVAGETLLEICKMLAPIRLIASKRDVIQSFYMKFAKGLYKWDLAQFFTPPTVTDFIVEVLNPQFGEHIKDPACGSADFLTAAFHKRRALDPDYADCIWGVDNSKNAVQVAVLNMLLNGDGKSNISEGDSLASVDDEEEHYDILVCNPPFGVRIVEKSKTILRKFELGHEWAEDKNGRLQKQEKLLDSQETGLLFVEVCVKQAKSGSGRIGIILPNGYLANRSKKYFVFREWLLRNCKIVALCSFPRFTFKTSGADVSATVVYLEKRAKPLADARDDDSYRFAVEMIENVGWNLGDKKASPRYLRNLEDGSYIFDENGEQILDADFGDILDDLRGSAAAADFPWLAEGIDVPSGRKAGWSVDIQDVLDDPDLTLDPKRHCRKFRELRKQIAKQAHFELGDVVEFVPEKTTADGKKIRKSDKVVYRYIEIADIGYGDFKATEYRGWELPDRAKHFAEPGDIYIGAIWGSVSKWCLIPDETTGYVVTNGCHRLRVKPGKERYLPDLVAFMCTEAYSVQMRGFARGSDGLAEISEEDAARVLIVELTALERKLIQPYVESIQSGAPDVRSQVIALTEGRKLRYPIPPRRPSHVVLV